MKMVDSIIATPHFAELKARDGLLCKVWINPSERKFAQAIERFDVYGLRALFTDIDLFVWQSNYLLHMDFERDMAVQGMKVLLKPAEVYVNDETVAQPECFRWIFSDPTKAVEMDIEDRRIVVTHWLQTNERLKRLYLNRFKIMWYC
jgi:hypothetical protein